MLAILAALATVGLGVASYFHWDRWVTRHFDEHTEWKPLAKMLTEAGDSVWWLPPSLLGFLLLRYAWKSPLWSRRCGFLFLSVGLSGLLVMLIKELLGRARPKEWLERGVYGFHPLQFHFDSHFQAFPSGHATTFLAVGAAFGCCWPRAAWISVPLCAALAFTRVVVNAHYVSDVLGGMMLGTLTALAVRAWFRRKGWGLTSGETAAAATPATSETPVPDAAAPR
ncbi:MAG: phosphatase PAP2 family protein [Planctomycetota bacterium]|nr:phosphatase PAP2 family protein [Planctomycetota bacterium]